MKTALIFILPVLLLQGLSQSEIVKSSNVHGTAPFIGPTDTIVNQSSSVVDSITIIRGFTCTKVHSIQVRFNLFSSTQSTNLEFEYGLFRGMDDYWLSDKPSLSANDTIVFSALKMRLFVDYDFICTDTSSNTRFQLGNSIPIGVVLHKTYGADTVWSLGDVGHVTGSAGRNIKPLHSRQTGSQSEHVGLYDLQGRLMPFPDKSENHQNSSIFIYVTDKHKFLLWGTVKRTAQ